MIHSTNIFFKFITRRFSIHKSAQNGFTKESVSIKIIMIIDILNIHVGGSL